MKCQTRTTTGAKSAPFRVCFAWMLALTVAPLTILADVGECRSGIPGVLRELGADVEVDALAAGDYRIASAVIVERKSVSDLHRSVATGRLWRQLEKIRAQSRRSWLIVEGERLDGRISDQGVRGAVLSVIETGIPVIWSGSPRDSALWLLRLAARARGPTSWAWPTRAPRRSTKPTPMRLLTEIEGISPRLATLLLERFGSIAVIALAPVEELVEIPGIGTARAASLRKSLSGTFRGAESAR